MSPAVGVLPGLAGPGHANSAEHIDDIGAQEQLDGIVPVDVGGLTMGEVGGEPEEGGEAGGLARKVDEVAGRCGDGREGELRTGARVPIVGRTHPVDAQIGDVIGDIELDRLGQAARQRAIDDTGDDQVAGGCTRRQGGEREQGAEHADHDQRAHPRAVASHIVLLWCASRPE